MDAIGVFSPDQARLLWQDYLTRSQLQPRISKNYPDRRPFEDVSPHRVFVKNTTSEIIPSYACLRITGVALIGDRTAILVEKPTSTSGEFLFNGPYEIPVEVIPDPEAEEPARYESGSGWAYRFGVVQMLGDEPSEPGAKYQPIVGSWEIEEGGGPFVVFGRHDFSPRALIGRFHSTGGGSQSILFDVESVECDEYTGEVRLLAAVTFFTGGCDSDPFGINSYGQVEIVDNCDTFTFYTTDFLSTASGKATLFYPFGGSGYCEPQWIVDYICGGPSCDSGA